MHRSSRRYLYIYIYNCLQAYRYRCVGRLQLDLCRCKDADVYMQVCRYRCKRRLQLSVCRWHEGVSLKAAARCGSMLSKRSPLDMNVDGAKLQRNQQLQLFSCSQQPPRKKCTSISRNCSKTYVWASSCLMCPRATMRNCGNTTFEVSGATVSLGISIAQKRNQNVYAELFPVTPGRGVGDSSLYLWRRVHLILHIQECIAFPACVSVCVCKSICAEKFLYNSRSVYVKNLHVKLSASNGIVFF